MNAVATRTFSGFRPEAIQFLADLAANNDRNWFQPRKAEYERLLKEPLAALCTDLAELFRARDIPLHADPARSPFRIYRDVRFAKDKSPYKTNLGAGFPWIEGRAAPSGSLHAEGEGRHSAGGCGTRSRAASRHFVRRSSMTLKQFATRSRTPALSTPSER
jgi:uncharacterized protein (TIGR02453 family)